MTSSTLGGPVSGSVPLATPRADEKPPRASSGLTQAQRVIVILTVIGAALLPLGLVVIILGWYGAAHSPYQFEQTSYLISGGLFGLGLVFVGGFLYFGAWMARLSDTVRTENARLLRALQAPAAGLPGQGSGVAPPGPGALAGWALAGDAEQTIVPTESLVATPNGTMAHRRSCTVVAGRDDLRTVTPRQAGFKPCRLCEPWSDEPGAG